MISINLEFFCVLQKLLIQPVLPFFYWGNSLQKNIIKDIKMEIVSLRNKLKKHVSTSLFICAIIAYGLNWFILDFFQITENLYSALIFYIVFFTTYIWIQGGIEGLTKTIKISTNITKWITFILIVFLLIFWIIGWIAALPPTTIIIILLLYIASKR
jgi:hypothetical protein